MTEPNITDEGLARFDPILGSHRNPATGREEPDGASVEVGESNTDQAPYIWLSVAMSEKNGTSALYVHLSLTAAAVLVVFEHYKQRRERHRYAITVRTSDGAFVHQWAGISTGRRVHQRAERLATAALGAKVRDVEQLWSLGLDDQAVVTEIGVDRTRD